MIETGKLAYLKTTEEPVFVLDIEAEAGGHGIIEMPSLENTKVTVRRPVVTQDGIKHETEYFYVEELETLEEKVRRNSEEVNSIRGKLNIPQAEANLDALPDIKTFN